MYVLLIDLGMLVRTEFSVGDPYLIFFYSKIFIYVYTYVTVHEKTMHNVLDINLRYRPK